MADNEQHALIVGASRGIGAGLVHEFAERGWYVTATVRDPSGPTPADANVIQQIDIDDGQAVQALRERLADKRFDLIFVVAGAGPTTHAIHEEDVADSLRIYQTNALSPVRFAETFVDLLAPDGRVAVMSSQVGSVANNTSGNYDSYRASKAALNTLGRCFAARHPEVTMLLVHPGYVRTDMTGHSGTIDVSTSANGIVDMLERRVDQRGALFVDWENHELPW